VGTGSHQENASKETKRFQAKWVPVRVKKTRQRTRAIRIGVALERQRLDKWLWHARVVKARTSAAALVEAGHVRVNGVREKAPGHAVKTGDVLTIGLDRGVRLLKVVGFAERRGDASAARVLYVDLQDRAE
jgi:ribosome-associated heat shock protein Hsp15